MSFEGAIHSFSQGKWTYVYILTSLIIKQMPGVETECIGLMQKYSCNIF